MHLTLARCEKNTRTHTQIEVNRNDAHKWLAKKSSAVVDKITVQYLFRFRSILCVWVDVKRKGQNSQHRCLPLARHHSRTWVFLLFFPLRLLPCAVVVGVFFVLLFCRTKEIQWIGDLFEIRVQLLATPFSWIVGGVQCGLVSNVKTSTYNFYCWHNTSRRV